MDGDAGKPILHCGHVLLMEIMYIMGGLPLVACSRGEPGAQVVVRRNGGSKRHSVQRECKGDRNRVAHR